MNNNNYMPSESSCHAKQCVVGSYESGETEVIINSDRLVFWIQHLETFEHVETQITQEEIVKLVYCHSFKHTFLMIYLIPTKISKIREDLSLSPDMFRFPSLSSKFGRIFLTMENVPKIGDLLKEMCVGKIDEIDFHDAKDILHEYDAYSTELQDSVIEQHDNSVNDASRSILKYPPHTRGSVNLYANDFMDLKPKTYLNDAILDLYIRYLYNEKLTEAQRAKIHIFDSFFYTSLTLRQKPDSTEAPLTKEEKAFQKYTRVKKWNEKVNLFEKDFIIVPINANEHWFLAIICYPGLQGRKLHAISHQEVDIAKDKVSPIIQSCILIFDSLGFDRPNVLTNLRNYLEQRYIAEHDGLATGEFSPKMMPGHYVKVPRQKNGYDCGLYVLQYVETFFEEPLQNLRIPIKNLENWFDKKVIDTKRKFLKDLIERMVQEYEPENLPLPYIEFEVDKNIEAMEIAEIGSTDDTPPKIDDDNDKDWEPYNLSTH